MFDTSPADRLLTFPMLVCNVLRTAVCSERACIFDGAVRDAESNSACDKSASIAFKDTATVVDRAAAAFLARGMASAGIERTACTSSVLVYFRIASTSRRSLLDSCSMPKTGSEANRVKRSCNWMFASSNSSSACCNAK